MNITETTLCPVCCKDEIVVKSTNPTQREQKLFSRMSEIDQERSALNFPRDYYRDTRLLEERCRIKQQLRDLGVRFLKGDE